MMRKKTRVAVPGHLVTHFRLGELLLRSGSLTEQDIAKILVAQAEGGGRFGEAATRLGLVSEQHVQHALASQSGFSVALNQKSALSRDLTAAFDPYSLRAEQFRTLRSELSLRWFAHNNSALAVIEARKGQGCSTLAANLAVTFAQLGERTLLIDANLRCPSQATRFGMDGERGLVDFVTGRGTLDDVVQEVSELGNLSLLGAGALVPNPQELIGQTAFAYLLETIPRKFDVVIVDTPPFLEFADARLIAAHTRGVLMATKLHHTSLADTLRIKAELAPSNAVLIGAVIDA